MQIMTGNKNFECGPYLKLTLKFPDVSYSWQIVLDM